ncbi:unnamed protein product [Lactuca virosa]|uniref:Uncharacterized protein n=1 Tax=Lactuca virosa TaxID=75947 RepID=A0AAU9LDC1_9ASTR|nr:unnamed protein product [Lactuca virosa]
MHNHLQTYWQAPKHVFRYLKGTIHHGLVLNCYSSLTVSVFSDSDWGGVYNAGRSTTIYLLYVGTNIVSWKSTRQQSVSRSSIEDGHKAISNTPVELISLKNLLYESGIPITSTRTLFCDNKRVTYKCANLVYNSRMKHVALDYHFVRE